ncbi:: DUF1580 [Gemmata massiliana]|uniref:: DUF1580 n=1 Tax=Gemmata massiliana TaxID=1210884 RepID=A0A6P2DBT1_9BACT|nr:DUF1580 domain-containing protein [Gemmata massiliana]VTR97815.1 : DUF1580 [Gemmata massiliana]
MSDTVLQDAPAPLMNGERLFSFTTIAAQIPGYRANSHVNSSTVFRWVTKGVKTPDGGLVRLEAVRLGTAWKTSLEAVARFSAKLTEAVLPLEAPQPVAPTPTPNQRNRAAAAAHEELSSVLGTRS